MSNRLETWDKSSNDPNSGDNGHLITKREEKYDPQKERGKWYKSSVGRGGISTVKAYGALNLKRTSTTDGEKDKCSHKMDPQLNSACSYDPDSSTNIWHKRREEYEQRNSPKPNSQSKYQKRFSNTDNDNETDDKCADDNSFNSHQSEETNNKELWRTKVSKRNLIVNYLSPCVTDNDLYKAFRPFGKIQSVRVMKDLKAGYSYGFGFVNFFDDEDGERAKDALNDSELRSKKIKVNYARAANEDTQQSNLYVSNLPRSTTEDDVLKMFSGFGEILHFKLLRDKILNIPRGVAFVRYRERNDALRAVIGMNGYTPEGFQDPIKVRIAMDYGRQRAASFSACHRHEPCSQSSLKGHITKKTNISHGNSDRPAKSSRSPTANKNMYQKSRETVHGKYKSKTRKRKFRT